MISKYFVVEKDDTPEWKEYIKWLNKTYDTGYIGCAPAYYGYDGNTYSENGTDWWCSLPKFKNNPTVYTAQEFMRLLNELPEEYIVSVEKETLEGNSVLHYYYGKKVLPHPCNFKYVICSKSINDYNSGLCIENYIRDEFKHLPVYTYNEWKQKTEKTMKQFELPKKWCVALTRESEKAIGKWRTDLIYKVYGYVVSGVVDGKIGYWYEDIPEGYTEITFEQFKEYVLKEKKMKVEDLKENEVIHCKTIYECQQIRHLLHNAGMKWIDGDSYLDVRIDRENLCFRPYKGLCGRLSYYQNYNKYKIYPASMFINMTSITKQQLKEIHDIACSTWKTKILKYAERNPFGDTVEFSKEEIDEMFKAATADQTPVLEKIFGKREEPFTLLDLKHGEVGEIGNHYYIRIHDYFLMNPKGTDLDDSARVYSASQIINQKCIKVPTGVTYGFVVR